MSFAFDFQHHLGPQHAFAEAAAIMTSPHPHSPTTFLFYKVYFAILTFLLLLTFFSLKLVFPQFYLSLEWMNTLQTEGPFSFRPITNLRICDVQEISQFCSLIGREIFLHFELLFKFKDLSTAECSPCFLLFLLCFLASDVIRWWLSF